MGSRLIRILGLVAGVLTAPPAAALEFEFVTRDGAELLFITGSFEFEDDKKLAELLNGRTVDEVWFSSGGGNVTAGQGIGRLLREKGIIARIPDRAICASACVDAFIGAPVRFVDSPYSIGIHMFSASRSEKRQELVEKVVTEFGREGIVEIIKMLEEGSAQNAARWTAYMMEMGAAPSLIDAAVNIPHDCVYWLSGQEMLHFNVVNTGGAPRPGFRPGDGRLEAATKDTSRCDGD